MFNGNELTIPEAAESDESSSDSPRMGGEDGST
jgi:hypothetical protein